MNKFVVISFLIILILSLGAVSANDTNQTDLSENSDEGYDLATEDMDLAVGEASNKNFADIQNMIDDAKDNDVIELEGTYMGNGTQITINKPITIKGMNNAVLDANKSSRIFKINSNNVNLENLNLINGVSSSAGAIMFKDYCSGGNIIDCNFIDNYAYNYGVFYAKFINNYSFENCNFVNNSAVTGSACVYMEYPNCTFDNCTFSKNHVIYRHYVCYSAMCIKESYDWSAITIINSKFEDNYGENSVVYVGLPICNVINNVFINNSVGDGRWDGILDIRGDNASIINSTFISNAGCVMGILFIGASDCYVYNATFINNSGSKCNGIYLSKPNCTILCSNFINNIDDRAAASIYSFHQQNMLNNYVDIVNIFDCKFINNSICIKRLNDEYNLCNPLFMIKNCLFINNSAEFGSAFNLPSSRSIVSNCIFDNNIAVKFPYIDDKNDNSNFGYILPYNYDTSIGEVYTFLGTAKLENNFWANNIMNGNDLVDMDIVCYHKKYDTAKNTYLSYNNISSWVNLYLSSDGGNNYNLEFISNNGTRISLPDYYVSIKDRRTGELIKENILISNGIGSFECDKELSMDNVIILNNNNSAINKLHANLSVSLENNFYGESYLKIKVLGNLTESKDIQIKFLVGDVSKRVSVGYDSDVTYIYDGEIYDLKTDNNGELTFKINKTVGKYNVTVKLLDRNYYYTDVTQEIEIVKAKANIVANKFTTTYDSDKTFNVKLISDDGNPLRGIELKISISNAKKHKDYVVSTDENGIVKINVSNFAVGKYNVQISSKDKNCEISKVKSIIIINKAKTKIKAPKVSNKYKKSKYFKITVKNKSTGKAVKSIKVKLKIYSGKKFKTYKVTTNKNGVAKFNTKSLKKGSHKVIISSGDGRYSITGKSTIKIK